MTSRIHEWRRLVHALPGSREEEDAHLAQMQAQGCQCGIGKSHSKRGNAVLQDSAIAAVGVILKIDYIDDRLLASSVAR